MGCLLLSQSHTENKSLGSQHSIIQSFLKRFHLVTVIGHSQNLMKSQPQSFANLRHLETKVGE